MSELLQVIFQKGVDQSVDGRVAPSTVHAIAENVRWRKDGRPAKRYGSTLVDTSTLGAVYQNQPANAFASWNQIPILAIGSAVRAQSTFGWLESPFGERELAHFGPGEHEPITRNESVTLQYQTVGFHNTALRTVLLYAWQNSTGVSYSIRNGDGAVLRPQSTLSSAALEPRCISTTDFIYVLRKAGTALSVDVFNPLTLVFVGNVGVGTLSAAGDHFDGCGRGTDFLITYQSAAAVITHKIFTAVAVPVLVQTNTTAAPGAGCRLGIVGNQTSQIFAAVLESVTFQVKVEVFNNALTASLGAIGLGVDVTQDAQPAMVLRSNTVVDVVWGGYVAATETTYTRIARMNAAGLLFGFVRTLYGVSPASKPFVGPGYTQLQDVDATYVWVETSNSGSTKWDTQRGYLLVKADSAAITAPLAIQLSVPGVPSSPNSRFQVTDVLDLGESVGFATPLLNALRYGNGLAASFGVDAIRFRSIFEAIGPAARDTVMAGRALQFSGGSLQEYIGELNQTGFCNAPVIQSIGGGGGGGLTVGSNYVYRVVYEYIDDQGRRHRSAPSDPLLFATGANNSATLVLKPLVGDSHFPHDFGGVISSGVVFHVYRTLANQGSFHRVTPNVGAPAASVPGTATVNYTDLMSDAAAGAQEFLYTEGGVLPNTLPPPCQFMALCAGRLWLGGQLDRTVVTASKLLVEGEPTQFSDEAEFSVFLPEKCTGLASIDGTIVAFARERIYLITGDGPNDQGIGEFRPPVALPTDVGCIGWRSVLETSIGVFFQGKRGIFLLPRGFGTPVFVGAPIEATMASYPVVLSSTLVVESSNSPAGIDEPILGEITARFVIATSAVGSQSAVAVFDLRTGGWSVDLRPNAPDFFALAGTFNDRFVYSTVTNYPGGFRTLRAETVGLYDDGPNLAGPAFTFISSKLGTVDVRPFGVGGYGGFDRVVAVGEYRGNSTVTIQVSVDGAAPDVFTFDVTSPDTAGDGGVYLDVTPKTRLGTSIRVTVSDAIYASGLAAPSEGFLLQALFIEHDPIGKTKRLAEARKG